MASVSQIQLVGFRNFKSATVNLTDKSLVIGANDVGKSNLIHALRLLLDRTLSDADLEPCDSDFYAHEDTHAFTITVTLSNVVEDCIIAKMRESVSDEGMLVLEYRASRDPESKQKTYTLFAGESSAELREVQARHYLRVLNLRYIGGRRDLHSYVRRERRHLLEDAREARSPEQKVSDTLTYGKITVGLTGVTEAVTELSYVKAAAASINGELALLSHHHTKQEVAFDAAPADPSQFVEGVELVSKVKGRSVPLTGDGRANQVQFALWAARENVTGSAEVLEVNIFCIEEPEAHLHPHQQRRLAAYLAKKFGAQVLITTHSPQIACEFPPGSIVRLLDSGAGTTVAGNGCNPITESAIVELGYRMSVIPAEALFATAVLLVEGPSEKMLFEAMAIAFNIDLDQLNVSILPVAGVGFRAFASLLSSLSIPFVVRTDNDIPKIRCSNPDSYRMAGAERCVALCRDFKPGFDATVSSSMRSLELTGFASNPPPDTVLELVAELRTDFAKVGVFLAERDLEWDLWDALSAPLTSYFGLGTAEEIVGQMQRAKADNMFGFLRAQGAELSSLKDTALALPLQFVKKLVEEN